MPMKNQMQSKHFVCCLILAILLWVAQPGMALVISEIMYHPVEEGATPSGEETLEFIELYNDRAVFEDLGGYSFTNGVQYTFPEGTILSASEYLVVARDPNAMENAYGITGVYGPFSGRLNNDGERIELSNTNGQILISIRYNDTWPWPNAPDGTGHTLILATLGGDPEEASSWAPSTFVGGTPGGPDETQIEPEDPTLMTLVDIGSAGRYFKGTQEPSPDGGGSATIDWTQIGFNDNPTATAWLEGLNGYGYSSESDELQYIRTVLNDMNGGYWSVYARLRFELTQEQIDTFSQLRAEVHYDDGYVLYLNGTRVADSGDIQGYPPAYNAPGASSGSDPPASNVDLTSRLNLLVVGTNVLAIQAHNSNLSGSSDAFAAPVLHAVVEPENGGDNIHARLRINELLTNSDADPGLDWLELYNPGPIAVDLSNLYLSEGRFDLLQYKFPDGVVLQPGEFYAVTQGTPPDGFPFGLGFAGETVFLTAATDDPVPQPIRILDAVRFGVVPSDVTQGRYPDGADNLMALSEPTFGTSNAQPMLHDIVINEIMYHHGTREKDYEYIELYNRGDSTVNLLGWEFNDGVDYRFDTSVELAAGQYLVVAEEPNLLEETYPNLVKGVNLFGPWDGDLDDHSERIRLSYPIQDINPDTGQMETFMVTADEVTYCDGGRWPMWADGQGASMELRDPDSDNNLPDAWADSDESGKSTWKQYSFSIDSSDSQYTHDQITVFGMFLLNRGEVLIDNVELLVNGADRLSNGGFESGLTGWRHLGNHVRSFVTTDAYRYGTQSLHLIATGHGDPGANRVNQSITGVTAGSVTFRFWAKWLRGSRYLLLRTSREQAPVQPPRPSYSFELDMPLNQGTPGMQNTAYVANRGPDVMYVWHDPVLPADSESIVVTAQVTDNDGVASVNLYYRSEGAGSFTITAMVDDGSGDDQIAGDSIYTATIPGASSGTMRAFYIQASDGSATTRFPAVLDATAEAPNRTCLVRVGDSQVITPFSTYRIWMSNDVINAFTSRPNLSNELLDCTFVFKDKDVFYNAGIRFRGSPFIRSGFG
ncbi:MAG: lamin tail domain-containing protein, partial [Sedimentisphaerales bacterium]|nr:lamin tail domain-containing protein [Sedimentisphaerales bacterium]